MSFNVDQNKNPDQTDLHNVLFDTGLGLIELKGTVVPWWRYVLYWGPS